MSYEYETAFMDEWHFFRHPQAEGRRGSVANFDSSLNSRLSLELYLSKFLYPKSHTIIDKSDSKTFFYSDTMRSRNEKCFHNLDDIGVIYIAFMPRPFRQPLGDEFYYYE